MEDRAHYLKACPRHRSIFLPTGDRMVSGNRYVSVWRCPVCVHIARIKVRLLVAAYKQGAIDGL